MTTGAALAVYIYCEQNGDTSKHWVSTGPTVDMPAIVHHY